jgi:hypothetical protein
MAVEFKAPRFTQKSVSIKINKGFANFLTGNPFKNKPFIDKVSKGFAKAMIIGANSVKGQMQIMNAVATGFMRKSIVTIIEANPNKTPMIKATIGTKAWYDILVHEGLGRHGGQRTIPVKYRPTAAQLAIVEPDQETRKKYYKASPRVPRPFLTTGIKLVKTPMKNEIYSSIRSAIKELGLGSRNTPTIDLKSVLGGGRF